MINQAGFIQIYTTGGTIDSYTPGNCIDADENYLQGLIDQKPLVMQMLKRHRIDASYRIEPLFDKDSNDLDKSDHAEILNQVRHIETDRVLITYGTDRMVEIAHVLSVITDKTIVLTGAFVPGYLHASDAEFNVGFAFSSTQLLPHGVYIAMSGRVFLWDQVKKDFDKKQFVIIK